jgi:hypothetical protein
MNTTPTAAASQNIRASMNKMMMGANPDNSNNFNMIQQQQ